MHYTETTPYALTENPFDGIGREWMLITTGSEEVCNTMTASWGQMGIMWNKPVVNVYIRPQRFSRQYMEKYDRFSVNFFEKGTHRDALNLLGTKSGRDGDKIKEAGLSVKRFDGVPAIAECRLVLVCKKLYQQDLAGAQFLDGAIDMQHYAQGDYHRMYIAEIEQVWIKEEK